jgi:diguanylate cyclase (GGDEF)-like protein
MERIVVSRWREPLFVGWTAGVIALVAAIVTADGGLDSPTTLMYLFPLLFASLTYPPRSVAIVYLAALGSYALVGLAITAAHTEPERVLMGLATLALAPCIGFLQAREHHRERRELTLSARTDALTGLLNHAAFQQQLDVALREHASVALIALDVDRFKLVNDLQGHAAGDAALQAVAEALRSVVRSCDLSGRMGGDEFMIALPGAGRAVAERVVERLALALSLTPVTASAGVAVFPEDGVERDALMDVADRAMYAAKRSRPGASHSRA